MSDRIPSLKEIADEINLDNEARDRGKKNIPMTDAKEPDFFEKKILNTMTKKVRDIAQDTNKDLSRLRMYIEKASLEPTIQKAEGIADKFKENLEYSNIKIKKTLEDTRDKSSSSAEELAKFKKDNNLTRDAEYPESQLSVIGVLLLMLLLEASLNGFFFAEGSDLGLIGGWMEATIIAFINVFFGFLIGKFIIPLKNAAQTSKKVCGLLMSGFMVPLAFLFNFLIGHYRSAFVENPDIAKEISVTSFLANPLNIGDLHSWFLVFLGMIFVLVAIYKGYRSDDAYPGYGRKYRSNENAKEIFEKEISYAQQKIKNHYESSMNDLADAIKEAGGKYDDLHRNTRDIENKLREYIDRERDAHKLYQELVARYREKNEQYRTTLPPRFFSTQANDAFEVEPISTEFVDRREEFRIQIQKFDIFCQKLRKKLLEIKKPFSKYVTEVSEQ
jgi:hypothetical protein